MPANDTDGGSAGTADGDGPFPSSGAQRPAVSAQLQHIDDALADVVELPIDAQVAVFTDLHQQLTTALALTATAGGAADEVLPHRPGPPAPRGR